MVLWIWPVRGEGGVKLFVLVSIVVLVCIWHLCTSVHALHCAVLHLRPASGRRDGGAGTVASPAQPSSEGREKEETSDWSSQGLHRQTGRHELTEPTGARVSFHQTRRAAVQRTMVHYSNPRRKKQQCYVRQTPEEDEKNNYSLGPP